MQYRGGQIYGIKKLFWCTSKTQIVLEERNPFLKNTMLCSRVVSSGRVHRQAFLLYITVPKFVPKLCERAGAWSSVSCGGRGGGANLQVTPDVSRGFLPSFRERERVGVALLISYPRALKLGCCWDCTVDPDIKQRCNPLTAAGL